MKRRSTTAIIRKMQIKTMVRYYCTPVRVAIIKKRKKKQEIASVGGDVEKKETLAHC